jgi:TfuA protein
LKHKNQHKNIIVFTGPSLQPKEAEEFLEADYRPPVARDDVVKALRDDPDIIVIIDGVFHKEPAVSHKEIMEAIKKGVIVIGGASMGALRASELDNFGMVGVGRVYNDYRRGIIESDDDVAVVINPETFEQLSDAFISMNYTFKAAMAKGIINKSDFETLIKTAKSIYYPKRNYNKVIIEADIEDERKKHLQKFLKENTIDVKKEDAIAVLKFVKKL